MSLRIVAQAVDNASLLIDNVSTYISIRNGVILHIAFLEGCTKDIVNVAIQKLLSTKIFVLNVDRSATAADAPRLKPTSLLEVSTADVLIVPQATMAGTAKGKVMQYHKQVPKDEGFALYEMFCQDIRWQLCAPQSSSQQEPPLRKEEFVAAHTVNGLERGNGEEDEGDRQRKVESDEGPRRVYNGTYGNRQGLRMESAGPMTHVFEF